MEAKLSVPEYARQMGVNASTIYRWIRQEKIDTEKISGVLHVILNSEEIDLQNANSQEVIIAQMRSEIEYLREENRQLRDELSESRQRSDTIILQLTRQFEEQTRLIEDMRHRSMWSRVKTAFGFAAS
jgi:transposase-like protein